MGSGSALVGRFPSHSPRISSWGVPSRQVKHSRSFPFVRGPWGPQIHGPSRQPAGEQPQWCTQMHSKTTPLFVLLQTECGISKFQIEKNTSFMTLPVLTFIAELLRSKIIFSQRKFICHSILYSMEVTENGQIVFWDKGILLGFWPY